MRPNSPQNLVTVHKFGGSKFYRRFQFFRNPTTPLPADRPHRLRQKFSEYYLRLLGILNDPFCCMTGAAKAASTFEWSAQHPKIVPSSEGIWFPSNTWYLGPTRVINPNGISIRLAVFIWVSNAVLYNELSVGKKPPKLPQSRWDFVTPPEEDRAPAMGNMQKIGKDRACGS